MNPWDTSAASEGRVVAWAAREGAFFASAEWAQILCGLGCTVAYGWNSKQLAGAVVPVFKRGLAKVGFFGFPVVGSHFNYSTAADLIACARELAQALELDVVRCNCSRVVGDAGAAGISLPEVWIEDLQSWDISKHKRLIRDLAFAKRATSHLLLLEGGSDPLALHRMYVSTVLKQGGTVRYTQQYFVRLVAEAERSTQLRILHVQGTDGVNVGFAALAMDGETGHYLHGAVDVSARAMGVSDLLLSHLVEMAQAGGMRRFSLMASPADQLGLLRFKRKWGDREGATITYDIGNGITGRALVSALGVLNGVTARWLRK